MRKLFVLALALLLAGGAMWAQEETPGLTGPNPTLPAGYAVQDVDNFDLFNAVPTLSTEYRYGGGLFGSYVDDFIDVNFFDPEVGTFAFLGGKPSGATVDVNAAFPYVLSAGFAKTFGFGYIGAYYGGSLVDDAIGINNGADPASRSTYTEWRNNLAVLLSLNALPGAFRLDLIQKTNVTDDTLGGNTEYYENTPAPSIALTYGGLEIAGVNPYLIIGYKFSDTHIRTRYEGTTLRKMETSDGGLFGIQAGAYYDLDDTSSLSGALVFTTNGAVARKGDSYIDNQGVANTAVDTYSGGDWGIGFRASYAKTFEFGKVSFGLRPNLRIGYEAGFSGAKDATGVYETAAQNFFQIDTGVDLGLRYQHDARFSFFTGASLHIIDFRNMHYSGGKDYAGADGRADTRNTASSYDVDGFSWDTSLWNATPASSLGFGMTFTPIENLVIGAGLNTILDKFFYINLEGMRVGTGTAFDAGGARGDILATALGFFDEIDFDLTVSYKF